MKTKIDVELRGFTVPEGIPCAPFAGIGADRICPIAAIDTLTLERLCDQFKLDVFKKAGKDMPPQAAPYCRKCGEVL